MVLHDLDDMIPCTTRSSLKMGNEVILLSFVAWLTAQEQLFCDSYFVTYQFAGLHYISLSSM